MRTSRLIRLLWTFYKNFLLLSAIITTVCLRIFWVNGFSSFFGIFWCKVFTLGVTGYFVNADKKNEYYYYHNSGLSKTLLWALTLSFDLILFLFLLIILYHLT